MISIRLLPILCTLAGCGRADTGAGQGMYTSLGELAQIEDMWCGRDKSADAYALVKANAESANYEASSEGSGNVVTIRIR